MKDEGRKVYVVRGRDNRIEGILDNQKDADYVRNYLEEGKESSLEEYTVQVFPLGIPQNLATSSIHHFKEDREVLYYAFHPDGHWDRFYLRPEQAERLQEKNPETYVAVVRADTTGDALAKFRQR